MAYSTGSYTGINDALNQFATFAVAQGWTQNDLSDDSSKYAGDVFTGRRLHIEKDIGGTDYFFNFRSCSNQRVFDDFFYENVTGICLNGSTGYNGVNSWDEQPGFTDAGPNSPDSFGGCVDKIISGGGTYYFFATATTLTAVFETDSDLDDFRMFTCGKRLTNDSSDIPFYDASGGRSAITDPFGTTIDWDHRSVYRASSSVTGSPLTKNGNSSIYDGSRWFTSSVQETDAAYNINPVVAAVINPSPALLGRNIEGSLAGAIVEFSPDSFRGNAQLAPSELMAYKALSNEQWSAGEAEGVKFINMKNYTNGQEITDGSDTYKLFRIFNGISESNEEAFAGVAFLK